MDKLIRTVISSAIPPNESLKSSDFFGSVLNLQEKIIDIFRYCSLQFLPPFLDEMLSTIKQNSDSQDKKTKFSTAVCITALINLFPNDENVFYYQPVISNLLSPGYRPIIEIGTLVLERFARISGPKRDLFLTSLIGKCRVIAKQSATAEEKYTAAIIWKELAHSYPEGFYNMKKTFFNDFFQTIQNSKNEKVIYYLLIDTLTELFQSEAASVGVKFLQNFHESLLNKTIEVFTNGNVDKMTIIFNIMQVIFNIPPFIDKQTAEKIYAKCLEGVNSKHIEIVAYSVDIILYLFNKGLKEKSDKLIEEFFDRLILHIRTDWRVIEPILLKLIIYFSKNQDSIAKIEKIYNNLPKQDAALYAYNLTYAVLRVGSVSDISSHFGNIIKYNAESKTPIPIYTVLKVFNVSNATWHEKFSYFKNQIIYAVRQQLSSTISPNDPTDRLIISLKTLLEIPSFTYTNAIELKNLIMKLSNSKDSELRELIVCSVIHLFEKGIDQIPLETISDLVRFALNDRVVHVRKKSLKAFTPITYPYLEQQDIFEEFCKFYYDESPEIRKEALNIIKCLKNFDLSLMRNLLLSSINLIHTNFGIIVPEITPVWVVFPNLIIASKPIIHIYAESFFKIFNKMLTSRFIETKLHDTSQILMNSAILKEIDESLIKSVTRLYLLCPKIVPIKPILDIFCSVLKQPVHPWTKENVLKSLKNIAEKTAITDECPAIFTALQTVIQHKESIKLVTKALKVMGVIGCADIQTSPEKEPLFFRSSLTNPLYYNQYMLRVYFKYLNDYFDSNNIDTTRIKICLAVANAYYADPGGIQDHLEPFLTKYLSFIKNSTTERIPAFLNLLEKMILAAGYLIIPYTDRIFQSIEEHWHNKYTKEASNVFSQLVISTEGRCDSILHLLVSASFLLIRSKKEVQTSAEEIFKLLRSIAQYCPDHLQSIIDGAVKIMSTPGSPAYLQQLSLGTIEYIIVNADPWPHLSMITRCLYNVSNRSQMIWRDQANKLLDMVNSINDKHLDAHTIQNNVNNHKRNNTRFLNNIDYYYDRNNAENFKDFVKNANFTFDDLLSLFIPPEKEENEKMAIWFERLCMHLIDCCQYKLIQTMKILPSLPYFTFKFAFYALWPHLNKEEKVKIIDRFNNIFNRSYLPSSIMSQFIGIIEFAILAEMDLGFNLCSVINTCISYKFYSKACFFLENFPNPKEIPEYTQKLINLNIALCRNDEARYLATDDLNRAKVDISVWMALSEWEKALELVNKSAERRMNGSSTTRINSISSSNSTFSQTGNGDSTVSSSFSQRKPHMIKDSDSSDSFESVYGSGSSDDQLISNDNNNNTNDTTTENNTIYFPNSSQNNNNNNNDNSLSEGEKRATLAIHTSNFILNECVGKDLLIQSVQCLASMENWKEIRKIKPILLAQSKKIQSKLARFIWMAELFQGKKSDALDCINLTGGYTVADCIDKSILYIHFDMKEQAKESFHLAWRYLASSICNIEKNNKQQMLSHIFQAEQLHELSEVLDIKENIEYDPKTKTTFFKDPSLNENITKTWRDRLKFIKEDPEKQKELFKIRSLVSDVIDPTEFAYNILQSSKRTSKGIEKLIDLFFPDPESDDAKYCRIQLLENSTERIQKAKDLLQSINPPNNLKDEKLQNIYKDKVQRLNNFIGKETFENATNYHDLDLVSKYLIIAAKNYSLLAQVQILRAMISKNETIVVDTINNILNKCIDNNIAIVLHQLEAMTVYFPNSEKVYEAVIAFYQSINVKPSSLRYIERTCVLSLANPNKLIMQSSRVVCSILATQAPDTIIFELLSNQKKYPELKINQDLLNILQSYNPLFFSQMTRIVNKLERISHTLYDTIYEDLEDVQTKMKNGQFKEAYIDLKQINKLLNQTNIARYDNDFRERFKNNSGKILEELINKIDLNDKDIEKIQKLIKSIIKKQDSIRVIPLSSLDAELGTKSNWSVPIFGKDISSDLKISKFFHSVQRLDNGLRIAVIGSDGKKYSFHLLRGKRYHVLQTEQFMTLLNALTPIQFTQRSLIELSPTLTLTEFLKGKIQLFDLITMYQQSKGQNPDEEFNIISEFYKSVKPSVLAHHLKTKIGVNEVDDLKKALLITSKNANMYITRTTNFAKTMGTLAAVSYIIGGADISPRGFLIDKTTGEVAYANFKVIGLNQKVPFRLTRMIVSAFGPCGVKGPFLTSLVKALKGVRKYLNALATCVLFALGDEPFNYLNPFDQLPSQYLGRYSFSPSQNNLTFSELSSASSSIDYVPESEDDADFRDNKNDDDDGGIQRTSSPLVIFPSMTTSVSNLSTFAFEKNLEIRKLNSTFIDKDNYKNNGNNETISSINDFYKRVSGIGKNINHEIGHLIKKAQNYDKLAEMPINFYSWW